MAAIIVGTASLIIVLSVFNGLEDLVKSLYADFYTDIRISPATGKFMTLSSDQLKQLGGAENIRGYSLVIEDKALLQSGTMQPVVLKGVDSNYKHIAGVSHKLVRGDFELGTADHPGAVIGAGIENALAIESDRETIPLSVYMFKKAGRSAGADLTESVSTGTIASTGTFII